MHFRECLFRFNWNPRHTFRGLMVYFCLGKCIAQTKLYITGLRNAKHEKNSCPEKKIIQILKHTLRRSRNFCGQNEIGK